MNERLGQLLRMLVWTGTLFSTSATLAQKPGVGPQLIRQSCLDCHDSASAEGELDLQAMLDRDPLVKDLKQWRNVAKRIQLGDMPPAEVSTLSDLQKAGFAEWFEREIEQFDYASIRDPGYEPVRRLTHIEYRHTIRDLFGSDLADIDRFPVDLTGNSGFDNSANSLFLQGSLFEKYAQSAESILAEVFAADTSALNRKVRTRIYAPALKRTTEDERASRILEVFASRAFRRKVTNRELSQLLDLFQAEVRAGASFDAAIQRTMTAVLIMPQFLMKVETPIRDGEVRKVSGYDLASRLSWFLWASMPDDQLFRQATLGHLDDPDVLESEIDRMLKDRRAKSLGYVFAAQWLGFDDVGIRRRQDPIDNPWCTESLMTAMRAESSLFFYSLILNNHPVSMLVDADYTYLNEELARHYRVRGIKGEHMRPVRLKTKVRGGIFTHASVLSVTAFPDRTSPVVRGKWVLDTLLGTPPPEPPPNVSEISEEVLENDRLSFRQKLQQHSRNPQCYSCHAEMDPIGFSLENYDNFGRWRTRAFDRKIDSKGKLPNGTEFEGPVGLRKVIVEQRLDDLTRQLTEKLLTYALGRQLEYYDEAAIRKIVTDTKENDYRFQTLIKGVITSYPFQYRLRHASDNQEDGN